MMKETELTVNFLNYLGEVPLQLPHVVLYENVENANKWLLNNRHHNFELYIILLKKIQL